jgi:conjugative relaxase-like TrwC/TraI family protein
VSVWWGLTGDPGLAEAHDVAVRAVLEHIERCGATTRVRVNGARQHPDTQGLTMAVLCQATSREDDPQIHTHVVLSAKVRAPDGQWMALDARYLKRHQRALGGLYQSVLRAELSHRYGVVWGQVENGQAEIAGMPTELLAAFSKRTTQVDTALADKIAAFRDREGRDPSRWERAALTREAARDTRAAKTGASVNDLATAWREEAAGLGWTADRVVAAMHAAARAAPAREPVTLAEVVEQLSARGSTWTRADVLRAGL